MINKIPNSINPSIQTCLLHTLCLYSSLSLSSSSLLLFPYRFHFLHPFKKTQLPPLLHATTIYHGAPLTPIKLLLDLGSSFSWIDCTNSTSLHLPIPCNSSLCNSLHSLACSNNLTCSLFPENPLTRKSIIADSFHDSVSLPTTNGRNPGQLGNISDFILSCTSQSELLRGLPEGVFGISSFGRSNFSFPAQVSKSFSLPFLFTFCLSSSLSAPGVGFFGTRGPYIFHPEIDLSSSLSAPGVGFFGTRGPYIFHPEIDLSSSLIYTSLLLNPVNDTVIAYNGHPCDEYFINVSSVKVNGKLLEINETLLTIDEKGFGGTKISTIVPYTTMESSIYKAFTEAFIREATILNLTVTNSTKDTPFSVCFVSNDAGSTRVGPAIPAVDLVMENDDIFWRLFGANLMVRINLGGEENWCLGFLDGGIKTRSSIVVGVHQMEDTLLQSDLQMNRVGFSSSLLVKRTTCGNFNFTSDSNF